MVLFTVDNGLEVKGVAEANRFGQMAQFMKGTGKRIQLTERVDLSILMETLM
jgi:hypothetical protein